MGHRLPVPDPAEGIGSRISGPEVAAVQYVYQRINNRQFSDLPQVFHCRCADILVLVPDRLQHQAERPVVHQFAEHVYDKLSYIFIRGLESFNKINSGLLAQPYKGLDCGVPCAGIVFNVQELDQPVDILLYRIILKQDIHRRLPYTPADIFHGSQKKRNAGGVLPPAHLFDGLSSDLYIAVTELFC